MARTKKAFQPPEEYAALLEDLRLIREANQPVPCAACGSNQAHFRCTHCRECSADGTKCSVCKRKKFEHVDIRIPWALTFAESLTEHAEKGLPLSPRQLTKMRELRLQIDQGLPFIWEKPAVMWLTRKSEKCWDAGVLLLSSLEKLTHDEVHVLIVDEVSVIRMGLEPRMHMLELEREPTGEEIERVRVLLRRVIFEATGFSAFSSMKEMLFGLSFRAGIYDSWNAQARNHFQDFIRELTQIHAWLETGKVVRTDCPEHLFELRDQACRGDEEAALILRDAIMEGPDNSAMKRGRV